MCEISVNNIKRNWMKWHKKSHTRSLGHKTIHYCLHCMYKSIGIFALRLQTVVALLLLVAFSSFSSSMPIFGYHPNKNPLDSRHFLFLLRLDALADLFLFTFLCVLYLVLRLLFSCHCDCFFFVHFGKRWW